jgi:hypothetical protein
VVIVVISLKDSLSVVAKYKAADHPWFN